MLTSSISIGISLASTRSMVFWQYGHQPAWSRYRVKAGRSPSSDPNMRRLLCTLGPPLPTLRFSISSSRAFPTGVSETDAFRSSHDGRFPTSGGVSKEETPIARTAVLLPSLFPRDRSRRPCCSCFCRDCTALIVCVCGEETEKLLQTLLPLLSQKTNKARARGEIRWRNPNRNPSRSCCWDCCGMIVFLLCCVLCASLFCCLFRSPSREQETRSLVF
mmetsp:Transcript_96715/g.196531  ORF Transcript_96715/g.196531 Transcript_96715/m.196531 type:complete len:218 (-) Transcript_96715:36-689(-)